MKWIQVQGRTLLERESSASKQVSHSKILIQPEMDPSYSFFFIVIFDFLEFGELLFFLGALNTRFLRGVGEGGASRCHMSTFAASEAKSLLGTLLLLFWGKFLGEFYRVNVHSVGVLSGSGGQGERLESLGRPPASLSDLLSMIPLVLEVSRFRVPVVDFIWDSIKRHDLLHERGGDSSGEEADQDIMVHDTGMSGVTLKC